MSCERLLAGMPPRLLHVQHGIGEAPPTHTAATVPALTLIVLMGGSRVVFTQADFSYYFDTGGRRRCYLAPERFFEGSPAAINTAAPLQPDMVRTCERSIQIEGNQRPGQSITNEQQVL